MRPTPITFHVGQHVVCVDASLNRRCSMKLLTKGRIYTIRAIELKPGWKSPKPDWESPGWGVHLEELWIVHPDVGCQWPIHPNRFRPVVHRPTSIKILRKLLDGVPAKEPTQLRLPPPPRK
jgi:hypothetical protein